MTTATTQTEKTDRRRRKLTDRSYDLRRSQTGLSAQIFTPTDCANASRNLSTWTFRWTEQLAIRWLTSVSRLATKTSNRFSG